jgi:hypothetical protein
VAYRGNPELARLWGRQTPHALRLPRQSRARLLLFLPLLLLALQAFLLLTLLLLALLLLRARIGRLAVPRQPIALVLLADAALLFLLASWLGHRVFLGRSTSGCHARTRCP